MKNCLICGDEFAESRKTQQYCKVCGKDSAKARKHYETAERINRFHAGDTHKVIENRCRECNKTILSIYDRSFCGTACMEIHRARTARCPMCKKLLSEKGNNNTGRGFCSTICKEQSQIERAVKDGDYISCETCGTKFIRKNFSNRFCKKDCYKKAKEKEIEERKKDQLLKPVIRIEPRICPICNKEFIWKIERSNQKFCTRECSYEHLRNKSKELKIKTKKDLGTGQDLHICTTCRTSQTECERFTSNFRYMPKGAVQKVIDKKFIIVSCPKFKE